MPKAQREELTTFTLMYTIYFFYTLLHPKCDTLLEGFDIIYLAAPGVCVVGVVQRPVKAGPCFSPKDVIM